MKLSPRHTGLALAVAALAALTAACNKPADTGADKADAAKAESADAAKPGAAGTIPGLATEKEHEDLVSEGIPVSRFPIPPKDKLN